MKIKLLNPRKAINKAFLKKKPNRTEIDNFKTNLNQLLKRTNDSKTESEEFHKNLVSDFLKKTYYDQKYFINTKERTDLVIHNGKEAKSSVGVIIETKRPTNKNEMLTKENINVKAFHELVLYYLRERITQNNLEIKYLIATNINKWFVFDSIFFEKFFTQNKKFVKQFKDFEEKRLSGTTTDIFYNEIAKPFIDNLEKEIEFTHFDIRDYGNPSTKDNKLIALFKLFSPEHLLKLPFVNDSNSLDKKFYGELLHIIGLTEIKKGSKKIIERNKKDKRNFGSLLENAIIQLDSLDKIYQLDNSEHFGTMQEEQLFNIGLELTITWMNRILFIKLLEAQLITYHKNENNNGKDYEFLNLKRINDYDDLNKLFFQILAKKQENRNADVKSVFEKIPYLNSSLFEPTEIEHKTIFISNLQNNNSLPIYSSTVLKDENGKKRKGKLNAIEYLFKFLNAYDFSSEGSEEIQEENKTLINASVLGLIFEKINGYKDGSFFTPGFITMYMSRETIRKAVIQKFNETKNWKCKTIKSLYNKIEDRQEANKIINDLKICDPAVGSGHFLVSALNEIIAIKNDLKILSDRDGKRLKEYFVEVINDELIVTDEDGKLFDYNYKNRESQRIQETLFYEKKTIIENCLFGVDINPNSVKICQLRLWIELLKNAYYKKNGKLETLPNIDINIKCGNSLVSRFEIDADLGDALKNSKWTIDSYKIAVDTYRNAEDKKQKHSMKKLINDIKSDFRSEISDNDPKFKRLQKIDGEIFSMTNQTRMFEMTKTEKKKWNEKLKKLTAKSRKLETEIEDIKSNKIYENAFEWRFEFPEVLDDDGNFVGFDVVIGNPPYMSYYGRFKVDMLKNEEIYFKNNYSFIKNPIIDSQVIKGRFHSIMFFIEKSLNLCLKKGIVTLIVDLNIHKKPFGDIREYIFSNSTIVEIINDIVGFENVFSGQSILILKNNKSVDNLVSFKNGNINGKKSEFLQSQLNFKLIPSSRINNTIIQKVYENKNGQISDYFPKNLIRTGITFTGMKDKFLVIKSLKNKRALLEGKKSINKQYCKPNISNYINYDKKLLKNLNDNYAEQLDQTKNKKQLWIGLGDSLVFQSPKVIILQTGEKITATYSEDNLCLNLSLFSISNKNEKGDKSNINLKFILSQLNSKIITYFAIKENIIQRRSGSVPQIRLKQLKELPIIVPSKKISEKLIRLVDKILLYKIKNSEHDTSDLENKIDKIIYELYGLTDKEIEIVENATSKKQMK